MKRIISMLLCLASVLALVGCAAPAAAPAEEATTDVTMQYITPEDAKALLEDDGYVFFDIRKAADSAASSIPGALAYDMDAAKEGDAEAGKATMTAATEGLDKNIVLICYSGKRYAQAATNALSAIGYDMSKVFTLEGGFTAWSEKFPEAVTGADAEPVKLVVATTCMTKPYSFYDENNNPAGSEIELWKEISKRTGYEVEFTVADFAGITAAVDSKLADVASNCLGYTEQRAEKYFLSDPYLYQGMYLTVREDDDTINGMADLEGKIVACNEDSVAKAIIDEYAAANGLEGKIDYLYTATGSFMLEVNLGRADALISQKVNFIQKMKTGEFQLKQVGDPMYEEAAVFLFRKDMDPTVVANVNQAVADMRADGTLSKIYLEWLEVDLSESTIK